jgi:putative IMPACT (imprinted ancient) family translation regulator
MGSSGERFRVSDDGEPSGTAGKPIFGQLLSREITNAGVIVVRYFGGSLLGVPGLINAYKTAASLVLQMVPIMQKFIEIPYQLHFDYRYMNPIMQIIRQMGCTIIKQEMQLFCVWKISVPAKQEAAFLHQLRDFHQVQVIKEKSE